MGLQRAAKSNSPKPSELLAAAVKELNRRKQVQGVSYQAQTALANLLESELAKQKYYYFAEAEPKQEETTLTHLAGARAAL